MYMGKSAVGLSAVYINTESAVSLTQYAVVIVKGDKVFKLRLCL